MRAQLADVSYQVFIPIMSCFVAEIDQIKTVSTISSNMIHTQRVPDQIKTVSAISSNTIHTRVPDFYMASELFPRIQAPSSTHHMMCIESSVVAVISDYI